MGSGPPRMGSGLTTVGSQGSKTEHTWTLIRTQAGVRSRHVSRPGLVGSGPICIHSCSPLRRRPDASTRHTACSISQRAEPGMTPLGYAPWHSLRIRRAPVHSTNKRRAQSMIRGPCNFSHVTISRAMTHHYSCGLLPINAAWTATIMTSADYSCVTLSALVISIMYFFHYAPRPACRGSTSLYVPPLNYKREGTQRYKGHSKTHTQYSLYTVEVGYYALAA
jgi:hypothetical protein